VGLESGEEPRNWKLELAELYAARAAAERPTNEREPGISGVAVR
jgi:hypothetical protein